MKILKVYDIKRPQRHTQDAITALEIASVHGQLWFYVMSCTVCALSVKQLIKTMSTVSMV